MRRCWIVAISACVIGFAVGATVVAWYSSVSHTKAPFVFSNRLRCRELAEKYIKDAQANDSVTLLSLESVDFSPTADSCFAKFQTYMDYVNGNYRATYTGFAVVNLVSGEELYKGSASQGSEGQHGDPALIQRRAETAFRQAMSGKEVDVRNIK